MSEFATELRELIADLTRDVGGHADGTLAPAWTQVQELGLTAIGISEDAGGSGGGLADLLVVIGELARAGVATPIAETAAAAFAAGPTDSGRFDTIVVDQSIHVGVGTVTADLGVVPYASLADRIVIVGADTVAAVALVDAAVEPVVDIAGIPCGRVFLDRIATTECREREPGSVIARLALARSASLIGYARGAYELTRGYVMSRHQFGAPLIAIPSVATGLAQMAVLLRAAQAALDRAVDVCDGADGQPLRRFGAAASARISAAHTATAVARAAHQLHGAVGITREYGLHRYTRSLWAQRDADQPEHDWSAGLGATVLAVDEDVLWEQLTA